MSQGSGREPSPTEPTQVVPEGAASDFAWLYRQDAYALAITADDPRTLVLPVDPQPSSPYNYQAVPQPPAPAPRRRNLMIAMIMILLCLTTAAVAGIALLVQSDSETVTQGVAETSDQNAAPSDATSVGQVTSLTPTSVQVGCQAQQSSDDAGNPVYYMPEQMADGKPSTAWRCGGDGVGQVVTFVFPAGTTIVEVGLVNGYAKVDPASGAERYGEYRRITSVTWTFVNGRTFQQSLTDGTQTMQKLSIPSQPGDQVTLTIEASTDPGTTTRGRDAVLISEVLFGSAA
jgi:hypothetical protein